jgi:hypothetical protein
MCHPKTINISFFLDKQKTVLHGGGNGKGVWKTGTPNPNAGFTGG